MTKMRLSVFITTLSLMVVLFFLSLNYIEVFMQYEYLYFTILILLLIPNFILRRRDNKEKMIINNTYYNDGNPEKFISSLNDFNKKVVMTSKYRFFNNTLLASVYIDAGKLDRAKELLESLVDKEKDKPDLMKMYFYLSWFKYYLMNSEYNRAKIILEEFNKLINKTKSKEKPIFLSTYAFYKHVLNATQGIYLEQASNFFIDVSKHQLSRRSFVETNYYLGLIEEKEQHYEKAKEYYKIVMVNGSELNFVDLASKRIQEMNKKTFTRENEN